MRRRGGLTQVANLIPGRPQHGGPRHGPVDLRHGAAGVGDGRRQQPRRGGAREERQERAHLRRVLRGEMPRGQERIVGACGLRARTQRSRQAESDESWLQRGDPGAGVPNPHQCTPSEDSSARTRAARPASPNWRRTLM